VFTFICVVVVIGRSAKGESRLDEKIADRNETVLTSGLHWNNLSVGTADGTFLLHDFSGCVENGHVCGILGPSGAGKSTTLSALGGTVSRSSRLEVNGEVFCHDNGIQNRKTSGVQGGRVAWMQQEDNFFDMLSVQETLELAAFLELPEHLETARQQQVRSIIESLGLVKLKDRKIGSSASHNGLSGGEKRRLSLALELISAPKLFLADEPSSGLDSTMSKKVVSLIKKMVHQRNIPCIVSLHQPQSSIFKMLDSLILLGPGGYVCYHGKTREAVSYFERLGYPCPEQTNPAEFLLDLVSIDSEDASQACKDELRVSKLAKSFADSQRSLESLSTSMKLGTSVMKAVDLKETENSPGERRKQWFRPLRRFGQLLRRSWRQNIRNHRTNSFRLFVSCGNAYLFSRIFHSIKKGIFTAKSVADRVALLSFSVINMRYVL
jgi:ABC-type multidrug transport system ATPase subunit